jgi:EAL domain-containing protein (putative c-di-GMP-specific phosphodiesterase class I)
LLLKVILDRLRATNSMLDLQRQGSAPTPLPPQHDRGYDDVRERALDVLRAEQRLRQGIARGELEAFYQPVVCSEDGRTGGFEALLRWRQPERGVLSPHEFIGLAESTGLIVEIGEQSMAVACRALAELQVALDAVFADVPPAFMAVNLSARQVAAPGLVERIRGILDSSGMAADRLKLEVTESVLMAEPQQAVVLFNQLRALGITLAIDDFGTGYSSLSYLNRFPIDVLKIDRSFVMHMLSDSASLKIVRTIIRLARELGMAVVAEGVEHLDEVALLRELGCDYLQGFLFAKPLPLPDALHVIRRRFF